MKIFSTLKINATFFSKILVSAIFLSLIFTSCVKEESKEEPDHKDSLETSDTLSLDTPSRDTLTTVQTDSLPDLKGTWTGTFDQRATTLKITDQDGNEFKGVITINYREVINQTVSGSIDTESSTINMSDQVHSRFMGKYRGNLSDDGKKFSGTFTMNLDNSKFNFNLTKR